MQGSDGRMSQIERTASAMNLVGRLLGYLWNNKKKIHRTEVVQHLVSVINIVKQFGEILAGEWKFPKYTQKLTLSLYHLLNTVP